MTIIEATPLGMIFIRIHTANLTWYHDVAWESVDMVGYIAQCPIIELNRSTVIVADLDVFIGFQAASAVIKDISDNDMPRCHHSLCGG